MFAITIVGVIHYSINTNLKYRFGGYMCTAISEVGKHHLFGRTLDLERSYGEAVVITPRGFEITSKYQTHITSSCAIIGMAHVSDGIPLYYDALNEHGLCGAALNFPKSAVYHPARADKINVASFELLAFVLRACKTVDEAKVLLRRVNVTPDAFSDSLPSTPLHWLFADASGAIVAEPREDGLVVCDDPFRVLTNEPDLSYHQKNVSCYMGISARQPKNSICPSVDISPFSRGMGAVGLPGDYSSASRFIRAVFAKSHTVGEDEVSRFFHVMDTVSVPLGCIITDDDKPVCSVYTSCADADTLTYYFTTYSCRRIRAVSLSDSASNGDLLTVFPIERNEDISYQN